MDRDRDRRRDRDIPPEDRYMGGGGQSYRPGNVRERERSPPPRVDSYRARSPPRRSEYVDSYKADTYRAPRARSRSPPPPRRDDFRRRSPSPPRYRDREPLRGDSYRARPRSPLPPRREDLPRDDLFRREPARDDRDFRPSRDYRDDRSRSYGNVAAQSPLPRYRERSPLPLKRGREPSPISSRGRRTPPPAKRERLASPPRAARYDDYPPSRTNSPPRRRYSPDPRDRRPSPPRAVTRDYRLHSRSPMARNDRVDPRAVDDWRRPRSPVREPRQEYLSREESAAESGATSRRSSPPLHPSRVALQNAAQDDRPRSARASPREPYGDRELYRAGEAEPRTRVVPRADEPIYEDDRGYSSVHDPIPPPREPRRDDDALPPARAPPSGPGSQRGIVPVMAPPTGPAAAAAPFGSRASGGPPAGPRGAPTPRADFAGRGRGAFGADFSPRGRGSYSATFRGGRGGAPPAGPGGFGRGDGGFGRGDAGYGRGGPPAANDSYGQDASLAPRAPPSGPRSSSFSQAPPSMPRQSSMGASSATTYPRTQRFANGEPIPDAPTGPKAARRPTEPAVAPSTNRPHPALADIPKPIEGGQRMDPPLVDRTKLDRLEDEAEKLRRQIEERETRKRRHLREWDRMGRETEAAALRSELAESALKELNGEAESQAAF